VFAFCNLCASLLKILCRRQLVKEEERKKRLYAVRLPFSRAFASTFHHKQNKQQHKTTMTDEVFPDSVKDFVFDLHDASRRSFIASEEQALYAGTFREMTAKVSEHLLCRPRMRRTQIVMLLCSFLICVSPQCQPSLLFLFVSLVFSKCSVAISCCYFI
jgi:hypothetical protein